MIAKSVPPQYAELHKSITSLSNVLYLGRVPFQETQKIFERSKVFINTSSVEGFPNCFLQAWWSKIPVVSLTFTCDGLLEDKGIGFVSGSIPKMCETLKTLLDNQELRDKYGSQEAKYLAENHLPESILGKYQSFLDL
jgi:glycosyltransferase involved in cell wall biosynthesis